MPCFHCGNNAAAPNQKALQLHDIPLQSLLFQFVKPVLKMKHSDTQDAGYFLQRFNGLLIDVFLHTDK